MRAMLMGAVLLTIALVSTAAEMTDHPQLRRMYDDDQRDRREGPVESRCLLNAACDKERQVATLEILKAGGLRTANDYFHAAMIFQHSDDTALAYSLASIAAKIEPNHKVAKWLAAAAWDRTLMRKNKPQWYGTQFRRTAEGKWELYLVDETAVTDEDRLKVGVPALAESRKQVERMNRE